MWETFRPEANKKPGVFYATTADGVELPIIDITHPAFALAVTHAEQRALVESFMHEGPPLGGLPKPLRNFILRFFLRGSVLADGIRQAQGSFMSGMHTYLLKLGPEMLGSAWAKPIDRKIAAALPALGVRLRLQDMARLMADAATPILLANPQRRFQFLNIAGGPAIDSLNTLLVLRKTYPEILAKREIAIDVLDRDDVGPSFGKAALAALSAKGGSLEGARIDFRHIRYDWTHASALQPLLEQARARTAVVICSSEGGLFEYGSDAVIEANLKILRASPQVAAVVGSVTRADEPTRRLHGMNPPATIRRGLEAFRELVERSGWTVTRAIQRPFSDQVVLT